MKLTKKQVIDVLERLAATAIEAALAYAIAYFGSLSNPAAWVLLLTPILAGAKSWIATHFGQGTAAVVEPTDPPSGGGGTP